MKNTKASIAIGDLLPFATNGIRDLSDTEVNQIVGGETASSEETSSINVVLNGGGSLFTTGDDGEVYTYNNRNGKVTESGTRPANLNIDSINSIIPPQLVTFETVTVEIPILSLASI